jgi:Transposase DDE domain
VLLGPLFQPFLEKRPICVMARAALRRILDPDPIDRLFARTAEKQYTRELLFSTLVELMSQVVLGIQPSVHAAYRALADQIPVSDQAVYDKLQNVELAVSAALVRDAARRVAPVIRALGAPLPPWLPGYRVKILDGNHLAATEHRLEELRRTWAAPLPGKALVVLDQATLTVTDVLLTEDGQAQERSLLGDVLPLVQRRDLWLADRNFGTLGFLFTLAAKGAFFAIRQHGSVVGQLLGQRKAKGRCATGFVSEQKLRLRHDAGEVLDVRRVTVELDQPTRDGDTAIHILTNLPAKDAPAVAVAELYRKRWTIEGLFLEVAQTLNAEPQTLAYPRAALFAFCLGLLASNAVALLKAALRAEHGAEAVEELSAYYAALDIQQVHRGMMIALPPPQWERFRDLGAAELAAALRSMARAIDLARYRKATRGPRKPTARKAYKNGGHVSTHKLLQECRK